MHNLQPVAEWLLAGIVMMVTIALPCHASEQTHLKPGVSHPGSDLSYNELSEPVMDSETVNMHANRRNSDHRLLRRSKKFFILGTVLTTIGVPLTIWGFKVLYKADTSEDTEVDNDDENEPGAGILYLVPVSLGMASVGGGITLLIFAIASRRKYKRLFSQSKRWQLFVSPIARQKAFTPRDFGIHFQYTF